MALIKARKEITLNEVKSGQVLEIQYDGENHLILVVDPEAVTVATTGAKSGGIGQGRTGKLHAIKLRLLTETDLFSLIKLIRGVGKNDPRKIYDTFKTSPFAEGKRNYRTYTRTKIGASITRISVGQPSTGTNKISIGRSVLYGAVHGNHIQIRIDDYDVLVKELQSVNYNTFYEGPYHEPITTELFSLFLSPAEVSRIQSNATSWEPSDDTFGDADLIGKLVAGWWNQTIADGQGLPNLKNAWADSGVPFTATIKEAFEASVGSSYQLILDNFKGYERQKRYSRQDFLNILNERGFNDDGTPTDALIDFNEAGHDQVFPEDNGLPPGPIKKSEMSFNRKRDLHLIEMMKTKPGIYFAGAGHLDNIRTII
jgi:hypothetical protein